MDSRRRLDYVDARLGEIRRDGLHRTMVRARVDGARIEVGGRSLVNLCSNDYLGLEAPAVGAGRVQASSRLVSGNDPACEELEAALAASKSYGAALAFPTGYMANTGVMQALIGRGDRILSDGLNHASIIDGARLSGARIEVYAHNDAGDLASRLGRGGARTFVVTEGVFSMDGDVAPLREILGMCADAGAVTMLDDAHGDFVWEGGTPGMLGVAGGPDVYVSSLSKALGSFGGYAASEARVAELCANRARPFIYTSALPSHIARHALLRLAADHSAARARLAGNARRLRAGLRRMGYDARSDTHIIPVHVGDERRAVALAGFLRNHGVFVQAIRYPTVPRGAARLRVSATASLSEADIEEALAAFELARSAP